MSSKSSQPSSNVPSSGSHSGGGLSSSTSGTGFLPGISFGAFKLGTDYLTLVRQLRLEKSRYGPFHVNFPERDDATAAPDKGNGEQNDADYFSVSCPQVHTSFRLERRTQRLESVIVDNVVRCGELNYKGRVLCGPNLSPTFVRMYEVLGPTFQGTMNVDLGIYTLFYPGLQISFSIPEKFRELYAGCEEGAHPLTLPDGSTPVACLIVVTYAPKDGSNTSIAKKTAALSRVFPPICGHVYSGDTVLLSPFTGCKRGEKASAVRFLRSHQELVFGMTPQDLVSVLGTPEQVYPKQDDRLLIHNPSLNAQTLTKSAPSYFFTYPLLGMDFMFDGASNTLNKVVAFNSTASPKQTTFLRYMSCFFTINSDFCPLTTDESPFTVTSSSNFAADVKPYLPRCPAPLLTTTGNAGGTSLKIYCFKGTIFNVQAETGFIDSVMIFETDGIPPKPIRPTQEPGVHQRKPSALLPTIVETNNTSAKKKEPHSPYSLSPASGGSPTTNYSGAADDEGQAAFVSSDTTSTSRKDKESDSDATPSSAMGRMGSTSTAGARSPTTASSPAFAANPTSEFRDSNMEGYAGEDGGSQTKSDQEQAGGPDTQPKETELHEDEEGEHSPEHLQEQRDEQEEYVDQAEANEDHSEEECVEHEGAPPPESKVSKSPWGAPSPAPGPWGKKSAASGLPGLDDAEEDEGGHHEGDVSPLPEEDLLPTVGGEGDNTTEWETTAETTTEEPPSLLSVAQKNQTKTKNNNSNNSGGGKKGKKGKKGKR